MRPLGRWTLVGYRHLFIGYCEESDSSQTALSWRTCKASQPLSVQNYLDSGRDLILRSFSCLELPHLGGPPDSAYRISVMARGCAHGMRRSGRGALQSLSTLSPCSLICSSRSLSVMVAHSALAPLGASKYTHTHTGENMGTVQMTGDSIALKREDVHAKEMSAGRRPVPVCSAARSASPLGGALVLRAQQVPGAMPRERHSAKASQCAAERRHATLGTAPAGSR